MAKGKRRQAEQAAAEERRKKIARGESTSNYAEKKRRELAERMHGRGRLAP